VKEDLITEFKKAITSTVKAIANNKDIEVVFDNNAFKSENTIVLPKIDNENDLEFLSSIRGNADNQALMYRFHDKETFELMSPTGHKNKEIYEVLENTRIQILGSKIMRGVKSNLFSLYEKKCNENQMFEANEQSDIDIQNALDFYLRKLAGKNLTPHSKNKAISMWHQWFEKKNWQLLEKAYRLY
jgi:cobaltochelatase CobT